MIQVKEKISNNEPKYQIVINIKGKPQSINNIDFHTAQVSKNNKTYFLIYNDQMEPLENDFKFLNFQLALQSINSRIKALHALKLLHCFETIIRKAIKDFTVSDVENLKRFLIGISYTGSEYDFQLTTVRTIKTVNEYLSIYRVFLTYLDADPTHCMFKTLIRNLSFSYDDVEITYKKASYSTSMRLPTAIEEVPMYISLEEYQKIIQVIREKYTPRDECIVRLMYECGLRIGEVLGLTFDDIVEETYANPDTGELRYANFAYLRNRLSDEPYQLAKSCMKIQSRRQYKSKDYGINGYGYQTVVISTELRNLIDEYIEESHIEAREQHRNKYYDSVTADRVRVSEPDEENNYYIFLNSVGGRLSQKAWNKTLKKIFIDCEIPLDEGQKQSNLNHRFRHGFAMFNVKYRGMKEIELRDALRHKSVASVYKYLKQTKSDMIKTHTDFTEDLYKELESIDG